MRVFFSAVACFAVVTALVFVFTSERQNRADHASLITFDQHAREAVDAMADLRVGQQAYVAAGQGVAFWMPKVSGMLDSTAEMIAGLRRSASAPAAIQALEAAATSVTTLRDVDDRTREYLRNGQQLMAGDVVFSEGNQAAVDGAHAIERARLAEREAADATAGSRRRYEAIGLGAAAAIALLTIVILVPSTAEAVTTDEKTAAAEAVAAGPSLAAWREHESGNTLPDDERAADGLGDVAKLCTEFGRVRTVEDLAGLLAKVANLLDARGLVVWMGDATGDNLRPVLAHGYTTAALERISNVPRSAANAAAAAYRTGVQQIVRSSPEVPTGAIVAPILTADGCVGVLSAETHGGAETSSRGQAVAALAAAHLAGILSVNTPADGGRHQAAAR